MLNRFSVSAKLYWLIFIMAVSLIGLGLYGINDLKKMNENTRTLYADRVLCMQQLSNVRSQYIAEVLPMARNVKNRVFTFSEAKKRIQKAEEIINTNWHDYKGTYFTPEEALLVKQTDVIKSQADQAYKNLYSLLSKKDTLALDKFIQTEFSTAPPPFVIKLNQLMELQVQTGQKIFNSNDAIYKSTSKNLFLFIWASLAIGLCLSFFIIKNIRDLFNDILSSSNIIKESEEKYRSLLEQASDAIYLLDFKGYFIDANESICKMTGYAKKELLQLNIEEIIDPEQLKTDPLLHGYYDPNGPVIRERRFVRKDGKKFDAEINVKMCGDDQIMVIARDITERKQAEELILKEKELSETIINSLPGIFYLQNERGEYLRWNKNFETVMGYTREEIVKLRTKDLIVEEDLGRVGDAIEKLFTDGYVTVEAKGKMKDGTTIPFLLTGTPIMYENQLCLLGTGIDISSRIKAEESLKKSEANLRAIMNTTDTAYALLDKKLNVIAANQMAIKFVNDQFHHLPAIEDKLEDYFPKERLPQFTNYVDEVLNGKNINYEINYQQSDGSILWYHVRLFPIINNQDEIVGLMIALSNVTDHKISEIHLEELNQNLQRHAKELAISNAELEQFAYVASHDLQEPLRMVTSFMTQLEKKYRDIIDDKGRQYIHFAVDGAKRMRQIILDLLDFSRVGSMEDDMEEVNFNKLINEVLALFRRQSEELNARIIYENLPTTRTYKTPVRQVFQNLISNSLKYHKADEAPVISIACKETKTFFQFSVKDNGIGIAPEYFDKIFIIFQRLHNKDEYSGTGMGLAIAKKIVENLGGKIWVESAEGYGSTFYFTLLKNNKS